MAGQGAKLHNLAAREEQRRLSKEELLRPRKVVEETYIDALGGAIVLQSLSHAKRQEIRQQCGFRSEDFDEDKFTMLSLVASIIEPDLTEGDLEALAEQDVTIIDELILKVSMLNMLGQTGDLKKESSPTQSSDSASN